MTDPATDPLPSVEQMIADRRDRRAGVYRPELVDELDDQGLPTVRALIARRRQNRNTLDA